MLEATVDVAAHVVRVVDLEVGRPRHMLGDDPVAKSRCEPLDLPKDPLGRVARPSVGDVAVGPHHVPALGRSRRVMPRRLGDEHERPVVHPALRHRALRSGHLLERPAEMNRPGR